MNPEGQFRVPMLGKLPKVEDSRTVKLSRYVDAQAALDALPRLQKLDVRGLAPAVPMYNNDSWGICGPAGCAHAINAWVASVVKASGGQPTMVLAQQAVTNFYVAVTSAMGSPFDPATGANDTGVDVLTMLKVWRDVGLGGHRIDSFVEVDLRDELYDWASCGFGGLILGYQLPQAVQDMKPWTINLPPSLTGSYAPGSWGGHCVYESANDQAQARSVETWGAEKDVSPAFDAAYRDEAWAVLTADMMRAGVDAISGLALADLQADLQRVRAHA